MLEPVLLLLSLPLGIVDVIHGEHALIPAAATATLRLDLLQAGLAPLPGVPLPPNSPLLLAPRPLVLLPPLLLFLLPLQLSGSEACIPFFPPQEAWGSRSMSRSRSKPPD